MSHILIVDDEVIIRKGLREYAEFMGYTVTEAGDGMEAVALCKAFDYDVVIMDVMMPKLDGFTACKEIKKIKNIPVLILSAKTEEYDKLYGFELGADDYVAKPFSAKEILARIKVIISRNSRQETAQNEVYRFEGLEVDITARNVFIDNNKIELTPKEYDLLFYLIKNKNKALSREQILNEVWGYDFFGDNRTVDTHIKTLRLNLKDYKKYIITLRGVGYKFEA